LVRNLTQQIGVEAVKVVEDIGLTTRQVSMAGQTLTVHVEQFERAIIVTYNQLNITASALASVMTASGFGMRPPERIGRVGAEIIIPRNVTG
jgi:hypothetical protein